MSKLTNHGDRVRVVIECGACGSDSQVSGDTFAEVEEKLSEENGFEMTDLGVLGKCPQCDGNRKPVTMDEREAERLDEEDES